MAQQTTQRALALRLCRGTARAGLTTIARGGSWWRSFTIGSGADRVSRHGLDVHHVVPNLGAPIPGRSRARQSDVRRTAKGCRGSPASRGRRVGLALRSPLGWHHELRRGDDAAGRLPCQAASTIPRGWGSEAADALDRGGAGVVVVVMVVVRSQHGDGRVLHPAPSALPAVDAVVRWHEPRGRRSSRRPQSVGKRSSKLR